MAGVLVAARKKRCLLLMAARPAIAASNSKQRYIMRQGAASGRRKRGCDLMAARPATAASKAQARDSRRMRKHPSEGERSEPESTRFMLDSAQAQNAAQGVVEPALDGSAAPWIA